MRSSLKQVVLSSVALAIVATTPQQSYAAVGHTSTVTESVANATGTVGSAGEQLLDVFKSFKLPDDVLADS